MRLYTQQHRFYAGVDLHARSLYAHVLDHQGQTVFERDLPACPDAFLDAIGPCRDGLVVGAECLFAWYGLADLCEDQDIPFVLGHALAMKLIHGGKSPSAKSDAAKLAALLRGGLFPLAYVYPRAKRPTRDLLRRRSFFVRQRAQLIAHVVNTNSQFNHPPFSKKLTYAANRTPEIVERFAHPGTRLMDRADLARPGPHPETPARRGEPLAELGQPGRPRTVRLPLGPRPRTPRCGSVPTPLVLDWPPRR